METPFITVNEFLRILDSEQNIIIYKESCENDFEEILYSSIEDEENKDKPLIEIIPSDIQSKYVQRIFVGPTYEMNILIH